METFRTYTYLDTYGRLNVPFRPTLGSVPMYGRILVKCIGYSKVEDS